MAKKEIESPTLLSPDLFRHDPAPIRPLSPKLKQIVTEARSRYVSRIGLLMEVEPLLAKPYLISSGDIVEFTVRLPGQDPPLPLKGEVTKVMPHVTDSGGAEFSLLGIRFLNIDLDAGRRLEAHAITFLSSGLDKRSARIPVKFEVIPEGIDLLSHLIAVDLSMSGMYVGSLAKFQIGKRMRLNFCLPFQKRWVSVGGEVVWIGEKNIPGNERRITGFGFRFTDIPIPAKSALAAYYSRRTVTNWA